MFTVENPPQRVRRHCQSKRDDSARQRVTGKGLVCSGGCKQHWHAVEEGESSGGGGMADT